MKRITILLTLLISASIQAKGITPEDIDTKSKACIDGKFSTPDIANCMSEELENWNRLLNQSYKSLMPNLTKVQKDTLRNTQRSWIKYKDLEYKNIESLLKNVKGTMYILIEIDRKSEITKQRALQLTKHLNMIENL